jgi:uncharacterized flavoprotein (TIGR03862 family)
MEPSPRQTRIAVIGAGPAGLAAAETASEAGAKVDVYDHMPSPARKFLMAGKSGLNISRIEPDFVAAYRCPHLHPMLEAFGPDAIRAWMEGLGQPSFVGSTGRVFPTAMKASPLLRAWLACLDARGVALHRRARWTGFDGPALTFADGRRTMPDATILAMGGASWRRLGSDGGWSAIPELAPLTSPFAPSNVGLRVAWTAHMTRHFGSAIKDIRLLVAGETHRGELVLSRQGLEGGGLYPLTPALRRGAPLALDLKPDLSPDDVRVRLAGTAKESLPNRLRKALRLSPVKIALLHEFARSLPPDPTDAIKHLPIRHDGPRAMDEAISTAGGLRWDALDEDLMLRVRPGTFAAGEMIAWEAPTGGYLLTACLATGRWAGRAAVRFAQSAR